MLLFLHVVRVLVSTRLPGTCTAVLVQLYGDSSHSPSTLRRGRSIRQELPPRFAYECPAVRGAARSLQHTAPAAAILLYKEDAAGRAGAERERGRGRERERERRRPERGAGRGACHRHASNPPSAIPPVRVTGMYLVVLLQYR